MSDAFSVRLDACYRMGKRFRKRPLFRQKHIEAYKKRSKLEAEKLHEKEKQAETRRHTLHTSPTSDIESVVSATSSSLLIYPKYADHSNVPYYPRGSEEQNLFHSWPSTVVMKSKSSRTKWKLKLQSKHCPFCEPLGRCTDIKGLFDHLESHHPDFIYKVRLAKDRVTITLKPNMDCEKNVDPLFIVGYEGVVLSSRKRRRFPFYSGSAKPGEAGYPFVLWKAPIPEGYGGYIPGAPGTIDAESFNARKHRESDSGNRKAPTTASNNPGNSQLVNTQNQPPYTLPPTLPSSMGNLSIQIGQHLPQGQLQQEVIDYMQVMQPGKSRETKRPRKCNGEPMENYRKYQQFASQNLSARALDTARQNTPCRRKRKLSVISPVTYNQHSVLDTFTGICSEQTQYPTHPFQASRIYQ